MSGAKPHQRYTNPIFGEMHWCPTRQTYVKAAECFAGNVCRCGKRIKNAQPAPAGSIARHAARLGWD